jgi:hypothetical protein
LRLNNSKKEGEERQEEGRIRGRKLKLRTIGGGIERNAEGKIHQSRSGGEEG